MSLWVVFRVLKFLGVALVAAGFVGGFLPRDLRDRQLAVYTVATPGLLLTWFAGYGLARDAGLSLGSAWIGASMLLGLGAFQALVWAVERDGRRTVPVAAITLAPLVAVFVLMSARPGTRAAVEEPTASETPVEAP